MILTKAGHQRMADHSQNGLLERDIEQVQNYLVFLLPACHGILVGF
jgi:hypothetical protein